MSRTCPYPYCNLGDGGTPYKTVENTSEQELVKWDLEVHMVAVHDVTLFRDIFISVYFVFLLFLDVYFSRATISDQLNDSSGTKGTEII